MNLVTWAVEADFDRNGAYETDITGDIENPGRGIALDRGMDEDGLYKVSRVSIEVRNTSGDYSPGNLASPRAGQLTPGVPIRIRATHNAISYTLWTGYVQSFSVSGVAANTTPICTFNCMDLAGYLQQYDGLNVLLAPRTTDEAYRAIASAAGLSAADYHFSAGRQTLAAHWVRNKDALSSFADVLQAEMGGWWWISALGVIEGQNRSDRLGIDVEQTWGDGTGIYPRRAAVSVSDRQIISKFAAQGRNFVDDSIEQVVFVFSRNASNPVPDSISIPAGGIVGPLLIDFGSPVETLAVPVADTDYTANAAIDGSGADLTADLTVEVVLQGAGFSLTLRNTGLSTLYVTKLQLRGIGQTNEPGPAATYALAIPGDKTARGEQAQIPFVDDLGILADFAAQCVRTYRYDYPVLTLDFEASDDARKAALLALELGDLIRYTDMDLAERGTYSDDWFYVDGIRIAIPPDLGGTTFQATVTLVPSYLYRDLDRIAWDTFNRADAASGLGLAASGDAWVGSGGFDISSGAAKPNTTDEQVARQQIGALNCVAEVVVQNVTEGAFAGLAYRYQDIDNHWRAYLDPLTNQAILEKVVAGVATVVAAEAIL